MRRCVICDEDFILTEPQKDCACGQQITRERATHLSTSYLTGLRRWWIGNRQTARFAPEAAKRDRDRKASFARGDAQ